MWLLPWEALVERWLPPPQKCFEDEDYFEALFWSHYNVGFLVLASFCFVSVTLISNRTTLIDFSFLKLIQSLLSPLFPYICEQSLPQAAFYLKSPSFDVSLLSVAVDEQYFISCHLDLLCLSAPALSTQFKPWFILVLSFYLFCNCIECFSLWQFLSRLSWSSWWTTQYNTTSW